MLRRPRRPIHRCARTAVQKKTTPFYQPNEYRVRMTCYSIPDGVEVRGVLDLSLAPDEHTPWIRHGQENIEVYSPYSIWGATVDSRIETRMIR
jgi:hypothetical protein